MVELDKRAVVVTGIGTVNPIGLDIPTTWKNLLLGQSGITVNPDPEIYKVRSQIAGLVKDFNPLRVTIKDLRKRVHLSALLFADAADQALIDAGYSYIKGKYEGTFVGADPYTIGSYAGSGLGGGEHLIGVTRIFNESGAKGLHDKDVFSAFIAAPEAVSAVDARLFGIRGPNSVLSTACASSVTAMINAIRIIQCGDAEIMVTGGSEASVKPEIIAGFEGISAMVVNYNSPESASRPFDKNAKGFVMAEGATALILESYQHAKKRGAHIYAVIPGYGEVSGQGSNDAEPSQEAEVRVMTDTLAKAKMSSDKVNIIHAHGTSTQTGDKVELESYSEVFPNPDLRPLTIITKSLTGHMVGASGAFGAMVISKMLDTGYVPYNPNLTDPIRDDFKFNTIKFDDQIKNNFNVGMIVAFGFHGNNTGLVLCTEDYYLHNYLRTA